MNEIISTENKRFLVSSANTPKSSATKFVVGGALILLIRMVAHNK